ncbi:hypothetical protein KJ633_00220 [bacterium]|nr:hypothetical protein [Candidatus Omnitrophota bacterium]MBA3065623.1 hypothetical protein [bacterium]MBU3954866.1 hypothetical protein [bacterium]MBU4134026.1 hypothetical protein [bacterium]
MKFFKTLFAGRKHYSVYVVRLDNSVKQFDKVFDLNKARDFEKPCVYVGMTGLKVSERFKNHKSGYKSSAWVHKYGIALIPALYEHLNPMTYQEAVKMEVDLAEDLRSRGFTVLGGH